jgi:hypothetical protein
VSHPEGHADPLHKPRFWSLKECTRLQGFPESFDFAICPQFQRVYYLIGNSVSPVIIAAIGNSLIRTLEDKPSQGNLDLKESMQILLESNLNHNNRPLFACPRKKSLEDHVNEFLNDTKKTLVPLYNGRGAELTEEDIILIRKNLECPYPYACSLILSVLSRWVNVHNYGSKVIENIKLLSREGMIELVMKFLPAEGLAKTFIKNIVSNEELLFSQVEEPGMDLELFKNLKELALSFSDEK